MTILEFSYSIFKGIQHKGIVEIDNGEIKPCTYSLEGKRIPDVVRDKAARLASSLYDTHADSIFGSAIDAENRKWNIMFKSHEMEVAYD